MSRRLAPVILLLGTVAAVQAEEPCRDPAFLGFDSRLQVQPAGRIPDGKEPIVGFEIVDGKPALAYASQLVILDGEQQLRLPLPFQATGLISDGSSNLVAKAAGRIFEFQLVGWIQSTRFPGPLAATLHNSGAPVPLNIVADGETTGFLAFKTIDSVLPIVRVQGQLRVLSWNAAGLAAVVGSSLVTWESGGNTLRSLRTDAALAGAKDLCFLGKDRALVSTAYGVYLVSADNIVTVLGAAARCRYSMGVLYVLDTINRIVWTVRGIEKIGQAGDDRGYALRLLSKAAAGSYAKDPNYLEASRILGCAETRRQMAVWQRSRGNQ